MMIMLQRTNPERFLLNTHIWVHVDIMVQYSVWPLALFRLTESGQEAQNVSLIAPIDFLRFHRRWLIFF